MLKRLFAVMALSALFACGTGDGNGASGNIDPTLCAKVSNCIGQDPALGKMFGLSFGMMCSTLEMSPYLFRKKYDDTSYKKAKFLYDHVMKHHDSCADLVAPFQLSKEEQQFCKDKDNHGSYCKGNVLIMCYDGVKMDCADAGLFCAEPVDSVKDNATCAEDGDSSGDTATIECLNSKTARIYNGNGQTKLVNCDIEATVSTTSGKDSQSSTVESLGGVCNPHPDDFPDTLENICIGSGDKCDDSFKPHCSGNKIITCKQGHVTVGDCSLFGLTCIQTSDKVICGMGTECDPMGTPDSCKNGVIRFCDLGVWRSVDCKSAGFSGCDQKKFNFVPFYYCK